MRAVNPTSPQAAEALALVEKLQRRFLDALGPPEFAPHEWLRDEGRHGGGRRFACAETARFNRASLNVSCVHYEDEPQRKVASATALSTILHPAHPRAPSLHLHASYTQLGDGSGTWRLMADLNPSHDDAADKERFEAALRPVLGPELFAQARAQGDRYFFIPAAGRHRGITHFYLEEFATTDLGLVERFVSTVISTWVGLLERPRAAATAEEREQQLAYHSLYFFQVLTLDRGTTSGLLVHDQNDLGVMGSLPSWVNRPLLASWEPRMPRPQDELLRSLLAALPDAQPSHVTDDVRLALAKIVRSHYRAHPEAMELQAAR